MGVPSLNDLAVDGTLNTTNHPIDTCSILSHLDRQCFVSSEVRSHLTAVNRAVCLVYIQ